MRSDEGLKDTATNVLGKALLGASLWLYVVVVADLF
jgi:hypothetical protein